MKRAAALTGAAVVTVALAAPASAAYVEGTDGNDHLDGTTRGDIIIGFGGDDVMDGRRGRDDMRGGFGDDVMWPGTNDGEGWNFWNYLEGDEGDDVLHGNGASSSNFGGPGDDVMYGGRSFDALIGNDGDDRLRSGEHGDSVEPYDGTDIVRTGPGRDFVYLTIDPPAPGEPGAVDKIFCGHGEDQVWYGGRTADPSDVIHESCEETHFGASRTEFHDAVTERWSLARLAH